MRNWKIQQRKAGRSFASGIVLAAVVLSLALATGALRPRSLRQPGQQPAANVVNIDNFMFTPMELTITAGATVTWINKDDVPHTVVQRRSQIQIAGARYRREVFVHVFKNPGTYEYFCSVHPRMTGRDHRE